jgi:hypothetical protein
MSTHQASETLPAAYQRLRQRLAGGGRWGSLVERNQPGQGGPRYQWSRRGGGKTVTVALSAEPFEWLQGAIAHQPQVWDIRMEMQQRTAAHVLKNLPNPSRRKRLAKRQLGLN